MTERRERRWRIGLTIAAAIVAVVMLATAFRDVSVRRITPTREAGASLARGGVYAFSGETPASRSAAPASWRFESSEVWGQPRVLLAPGWIRQPVGGLMSSAIRVPLWPALTILSLAAGWLWRRHLTWPAHLCRNCRYDLRGGAGTACPECGATVGR